MTATSLDFALLTSWHDLWRP